MGTRVLSCSAGTARVAGADGLGDEVSLGAGWAGVPIALMTVSMCCVSRDEVRKNSTNAGPSKAVLL